MIMFRSVLVLTCVTAFAMTPAHARQDDDASPAEEPLVFPGELILLPADVQDAAQAEAQQARVPEGGGGDVVPSDANPVEDAYTRAQLAHAAGDWETARIYAETAGSAGHDDAAVMAGLLALDGWTDAAEPEAQAVRWFQRAAEDQHPLALYHLGLIARDSDTDHGLGSARSWFRQSAEAGHVGGMIAYADVLESSGVPQDIAQSRVWTERAAQLGSQEAMYQLARLHDLGRGGEQDLVSARHWYEQAGGLGHPESAFEAGMMWALGQGGESDDVNARRWLRLSAETGYAPAQGQLGLMLYQGRGGPENIDEAVHWVRLGSLAGDPEAQFIYAYALARGDTGERDIEAAYGWVLRAATDAEGLPLENPVRDRFQAALEGDLPLATQIQIQEAVAAER